MKIRADFVTNSSSVSYIVSFNPDMADWGTTVQAGDFKKGSKKRRIFELLSGDLQKAGEIMEKNGNTIYLRQYDFSKKPDSKFDGSFDKPIEEVDFDALSDDEVWAYIYGEYLVNARLAGELKGFGMLQVPRDKEILKRKKEAFLERKAKEDGAT